MKDRVGFFVSCSVTFEPQNEQKQTNWRHSRQKHVDLNVGKRKKKKKRRQQQNPSTFCKSVSGTVSRSDCRPIVTSQRGN